MSDDTFLPAELPTPSPEAVNTAVVERLIQAWNAGDIGMLSELWTPGMVHHGREQAPTDAQLTAAEMERFLTAFPDLKMVLQSVVAQDDLVSTRIELRATHYGDYCGIPATGREVRCRLMGQLRFVDGRVVEHWGVADGLHLLVQLGAVPAHLLAATA